MILTIINLMTLKDVPGAALPAAGPGAVSPCKMARCASADNPASSSAPPDTKGASVASESTALVSPSRLRAAHAAKLIVLERQGLAKLVSDRLKHLSSQRGVDAVPTHCRDASCAARVSAQRVTLDAGALETQLDAGVRRFSALLNWARAAAAFDDILYIAYGDLVADPERELRRAYRFLGVDEAWQANASVLTKSVSRPLAEVVANYGEVRAALLLRALEPAAAAKVAQSQSPQGP